MLKRRVKYQKNYAKNIDLNKFVTLLLYESNYFRNLLMMKTTTVVQMQEKVEGVEVGEPEEDDFKFKQSLG